MSDDFAGYRVSPAQLHLHRLRQALSGGAAASPFTVRVEATVTAGTDPNRLAAALRDHAAEHEILRTTVTTTPGAAVPVQIIGDRPQLDLGIDQEHPAGTGAAPLSLDAARLPGDAGWRLTLSVDPACADLATAVRLLAAVAGGGQGATPVADDEPIQYADVAEWFHQVADEPETAAARDRWRRELAADEPAPGLPLEPGAADGFLPRYTVLTLDPGLSRQVAARAATLGVSEAELVTAAWAMVLADGTDAETVRLGVTVDGRGAPEFHGAPGPYDRTVPVRVAPAGRNGAALVQAVAAAVREAVEDVDVFRWEAAPATGTEPYCRYSVGHLDLGTTAPGLDGPVVHDASDRFDLRLLAVRQASDRLELHCGYDALRCDAQLAGLLPARTAAVLAHLCDPADPPMGSLVLRTDQDAALTELHGSGAPLAGPPCTVLDLIRDQVAARPEATAVSSHDGRLSYAELDTAADTLATALRAAGCVPGDRVALCMARGVLLPVAVLAILRCGAGYLPLDSRNPAERLAGMAVDGSAALLLADQDGRNLLARALPGLPVVDPQAAWATDGATAADVAGAAPVTADTTAYVIFTSGSTGRPKGVEVTHGNLAHSTRGRLQHYGLGQDSSTLLIPTIAFDSSVAPLFGTLCAGGHLVVPSDKESTDPTGLARLVDQHRVTDLLCVPSLHQTLLEEFTGTGGTSLRRVTVAGEECRATLVRRHTAVLPNAALFNEYGPTEGSVWCSVQRCTPAPDGERVPIGRPSPGTRLYVVGTDGERVPYGARGELYIGGPGVAAGYAGRPELTAERFLPDRFGPVPHSRLYRTGDLVRFRADGTLEFLGRTDRQVKVRGFRVELEEIESRVAAQPSVSAVAVVDRRDATGTVQLAAFAVLRAPATAESVRAALIRDLPPYMVPVVTAVAELPSLPNGKVDYAELRLRTPASAGADYLAPRGPVEQALTEVWQQVLGVDRVGVRDNFFDLGGDSIRVVQVRSAARRRGLQLQVTDLMQHPTIAALAPRVTATDAEAGREPAAPRSPLLPAAVRAELPEWVEEAWPLSSLQAGMLFHTAFENGENLLYHDVTTLRLRTLLDPTAFEQAVGELCARHQMLRVGFDLGHAAGPLQLVHRAVQTPLRTVDLRLCPPAEQRGIVERDVAAERTTPFATGSAPLVRFVLHLLGEDEFQLTLAVHHAVLDGWSVTVLLADLMDCYRQLTEPDGSRPDGSGPAGSGAAPAPAGSYSRFLELEQAALEGGDAQWWANRTEDPPIGRLGGGALSDGAGTRRLGAELSPQSCEALRLIAQQAGVPLKSALLAVHLKVLSLMTGRDDVVTGLVTNCRPEDEEGSENLLGLFLNTLPMRTALPRGSWLDLVRHTFAEEREMLPHRWYPMSRIRQAGQAGSLFEAAFNYVRFHRYGELSTRSDLTVLETGFHGDTNLPLMTDFMQDPVSGRIELSIAFDSSRYDTTFIEAMVDRYRRALDALTEGPDLPHSADAVLSEAERDLLARAAQGPCVPASTTQTANAGDARPTADALTAAVESALRTHADRPAINADGRTVDYGELAATARTCGAAVRAALACTDRGAGSTVALLLPRGIELVTVALGCLLAGVPFVVCDPAQAPERLHRALVDADAGLVVAGSDDLAAALPAGVPCYPPHRLRAAPDPGPPAAPHPDDLAYLVFTSGSTGRPKPVAVTRRALANRLDWSQRAYPLQPEDRVLALASPVFDFAIWECFAPLLAGACVVAAPDLMDSGTGLGDLLRQTGATVAHLVPSLLGGLVDDPALAHCTRLRLLLVGGETFPTSLLDQLRTVLSCEVINQYGPAEATIDATFHRVGAPRHTPADRSGSTVPIGRPIDNVSIHLLGENLLRVPPGCVGEVFIGGAAVARGYHGRPGATAAAFLPDPWTGTPGARMYRTGDLARLLPDGALEFLGRIDDQVQVNGVRVELGEVEAALREGGLVEQAVVVAHRSGRGALQLVAHAVARPGSAVSGEQVLAGLDGLPRALRPARVVLRSELPRTASGKIDRRALEAIGTTESPGGRPRLPAPPTTGLERRLAELWSQVLDTPDPGVEDDFFDLGGDSISALQLVARGRRDGIGLTPRLIYAHRTIRTVARALEAVVLSPAALSPAAAEPAAGAALVSLRQGSGATPFFCVHASNGSSAPYAALAAALPRPRPFFGLDAEGLRPDGPELASVPALAAHYLAQVRDRQPQGPYLFGGWSTGGAIAFEMAVQARAQGEEVAALILLDPSVPPMLAGPPEHALLLWLFLRDLAGLTGRPMPALTVDRLRSLEPGARVAATIEAIREAALVPEEVVDQLAAQMDVFCALVGAAAVWNPRRYDGPLTLLVAGSDEEAQHRLTGWRSFTGADAVAHAVGGTHHTMLRRPALDGLAPLLDQCLTTATGTGTTP